MVLHDSRLLADVPDLIGSGPALPFLFGPLLCGYLKASVNWVFHWHRAYWPHLMPFARVLLGHIPFNLQPFPRSERLSLVITTCRI